MTGLEHIRLQNRTLLDCPVFPMGVYGASILDGDGSWAIAVKSPRVTEQGSAWMDQTRRGPLIVRSVVVEVPTKPGHLKSLVQVASLLFLPTLFAH